MRLSVRFASLSFLRTALALAAVALAVPATHAQMCMGDVTLRTQTEVNAFACSEVEGTLHIGERFLDVSDITDLEALAALTSVGGLAVRGNPGLVDLDDLSNLTSITGIPGGTYKAVSIVNNGSLANIDGISGITSPLDNLFIDRCPSLTHINGFNELPRWDRSTSPTLESEKSMDLTDCLRSSSVLKSTPSRAQ